MGCKTDDDALSESNFVIDDKKPAETTLRGPRSAFRSHAASDYTLITVKS